ncbi:MAG: ATP synthase subunit I [Zetaproteobacteria bacterium]|nr:ATP synthase subunit I [Zetaproteobacteria bacterium]
MLGVQSDKRLLLNVDRRLGIAHLFAGLVVFVVGLAIVSLNVGLSLLMGACLVSFNGWAMAINMQGEEKGGDLIRRLYSSAAIRFISVALALLGLGFLGLNLLAVALGMLAAYMIGYAYLMKSMSAGLVEHADRRE